jgi:hypothetical protein
MFRTALGKLSQVSMRHLAAEGHAAELISEPLRLVRIFCRSKTGCEIVELFFFALPGLNTFLDEFDQDAAGAKSAGFRDRTDLLSHRGR